MKDSLTNECMLFCFIVKFLNVNPGLFSKIYILISQRKISYIKLKSKVVFIALKVSFICLNNKHGGCPSEYVGIKDSIFKYIIKSNIYQYK